MIYTFVVSFSLGIIFEQVFNFGWSIGAFVFLVSVVLSFYFRSEGQPLKDAPEGLPLISKIIFAVGIAFCIGVLRASFADTAPSPELAKLVGQKIYFEATITEEPDIRDTSARYTVDPNFLEECVSGRLASLTEATLSQIFSRKFACPQEYISEESLVLLIAERFPEFKYGDKISVSGRLDLPKNFDLPAQAGSENGTEFDYVSYLSKDKIHFLIYHPEIKRLGSGEGNPLIASLYSLKNKFIQKISAVVPEPDASFLGGVIFGAKQSLGQNLLDDFRKAGLIHVIVLSGYNITIIAVGVFYLTSLIGKRNLGFIISVIFIILFTLMVGLGATVLRAMIMALIAILAKFLGRPAEALRWLFIAGLLMLLWNPLTLLQDPSFQLSFAATLGLILFSPFIENFISGSKLQKFIPNKFKLREIISSTLAVQFFVLPLLIKMSGFVSLISFVVNPIVLPLVPWAMGLGALTGALGLLPFVGHILSWPVGILAYALTRIIISITELSASLPLATFQTGTLPLWLIFVWYLGYGILFWKLTSPRPA